MVHNVNGRKLVRTAFRYTAYFFLATISAITFISAIGSTAQWWFEWCKTHVDSNPLMMIGLPLLITSVVFGVFSAVIYAYGDDEQ